MTRNFIPGGEFEITWRADCLTERKYVGRARVTRELAEEDAARHLAQPGNENHRVEIEIKQRSYL